MMRARIAAAVPGATTGAEYSGFERNLQHQRVDDAFDGPCQRTAVVAAEHLDAGADGPPRLVDHRPAWVARCLTG